MSDGIPRVAQGQGTREAVESAGVLQSLPVLARPVCSSTWKCGFSLLLWFSAPSPGQSWTLIDSEL